eukprot:364464-Chlamydomonas_euryale.AAC.8
MPHLRAAVDAMLLAQHCAVDDGLPQPVSLLQLAAGKDGQDMAAGLGNVTRSHEALSRVREVGRDERCRQVRHGPQVLAALPPFPSLAWTRSGGSTLLSRTTPNNSDSKADRHVQPTDELHSSAAPPPL